LASTWLQQIRTWRREDRLRSETRAAEQRREERRDVLKLFIDFLTACNRANALYALPGDGADKEAIRQFSDLVDERWAVVQGGSVVFMAVGHDHETRASISGLIDAAETLTAKLRGLQRPTAEQRKSVSDGCTAHYPQFAASSRLLGEQHGMTSLTRRVLVGPSPDAAATRPNLIATRHAGGRSAPAPVGMTRGPVRPTSGTPPRADRPPAPPVAGSQHPAAPTLVRAMPSYAWLQPPDRPGI
jgi:hypothetical protein